MSFEQATFIEPLGTIVRGASHRITEAGTERARVRQCALPDCSLSNWHRPGGRNIIATDVSPYRLEKARQFGATHAIAADVDVPAFMRKVNDNRLADVSILCAGAVPPARTVLNSVERGGTILFFAVPKPGETLDVDFNPFWRDDITIKTCYGAAPLDNFQALELIRHGTVNVNDLVTHRFGIDEIGEAFKTGAKPDGSLKVVIEPNR